MPTDTRFRVMVKYPFEGVELETPLYTEASTAREAGLKVGRDAKRPRLGRVVSTTAICDAQGREGVWTFAEC